jgi:hypothetical protein
MVFCLFSLEPVKELVPPCVERARPHSFWQVSVRTQPAASGKDTMSWSERSRGRKDDEREKRIRSRAVLRSGTQGRSQ